MIGCKDLILLSSDPKRFHYISRSNRANWFLLSHLIRESLNWGGWTDWCSIDVLGKTQMQIRLKTFLGDHSTIDSFSASKFQPNEIIFHKVIDTKSNNVLGCKKNDTSNHKYHILSNNNSDQINFFSWYWWLLFSLLIIVIIIEL